MTSSPVFLIYNFPKQIATNCQIKVAASGFTLQASCSSIYLGLLSFQRLPSSLNKNIVKIIVTWNVSSSPQWFQINGVIISTFPDSSSKCQIFPTKKNKIPITHLYFSLHSIHSFILLLQRSLQLTGNFLLFSKLFNTTRTNKSCYIQLS